MDGVKDNADRIMPDTTATNEARSTAMQVEKPAPIFDIAIAGGSHAGLALGLALARLLGPDLRVAIVERANPAARPQQAADPRAFAIAAGSRNLLAAIGVWPALASGAEPVRTIEITDSSLANAIRPVLLTYDNHIAPGEPATFIVEAEAARRALLAAALAEPCITFLAPAGLESFDVRPSGVVLRLANGERLRANLLVAADGAKSPTRNAAGIRTLDWSTGQVGLVTTVTHARPHSGLAVQHFLPAGPFAMLPLTGNRSCVTWTEAAERGREIMALDDAGFLAEVEQRFGFKLGAIELAGPRALWPLEFHLARAIAGTRIALVGDAVRSVHPLAGQGLNLAFRDVAALAEVVADAMRLGLDPGDAVALERYERWRRFDSHGAAAAFGALNTLFSNDSTLIRAVRGAGLGVVDRLDGVKQLLVTEAAGLTGDVPKLMQG